jgi:AcrR family transcriptional regulator
LYKHFRDKEEIFLRVLRERAPRFSDALTQLPERAGTGEPADHLTEVVRAGVAFYRRSFPMSASLFAHPDLLASVRRKLPGKDAGPREPTRLIAHYLSLEQEHERISATIDPDAAATLLVGACFHRAFLELFFADEAPADVPRPARTEEFATEVVRALLDGLRP